MSQYCYQFKEIHGRVEVKLMAKRQETKGKKISTLKNLDVDEYRWYKTSKQFLKFDDI